MPLGKFFYFAHFFLSNGQMPPALSEGVEQRVVILLTKKESVRKIQQEVGVSLAFITKIRKKHHVGHSGKKGGRPRKLDEKTRRSLVRIMKKGDVDNAKQANNELKRLFGMDVSDSTNRRRLKEIRFFARHKIKKPVLFVKQKKP